MVNAMTAEVDGPRRYYNWCAVTHSHAMMPDANGAYVAYEDYQRLQRDLRECVELLGAVLDDVAPLDGTQWDKSSSIGIARALLARLKGTPNLSALQESDSADSAA